jgi:hypothetical protein
MDSWRRCRTNMNCKDVLSGNTVPNACHAQIAGLRSSSSFSGCADLIIVRETRAVDRRCAHQCINNIQCAEGTLSHICRFHLASSTVKIRASTFTSTYSLRQICLFKRWLILGVRIIGYDKHIEYEIREIPVKLISLWKDGIIWPFEITLHVFVVLFRIGLTSWRWLISCFS